MFELAVIQFSVSPNKAQNLAKAQTLIQKASSKAQWIVLPELFNTSYEVHDWNQAAESLEDGETPQKLSDWAQKYGVYLVGGSFAEAKDGKVYNSSTLWGPDGKLLLVHRKVHLFDVNLPQMQFRESDFFNPGSEIQVAQTPWGKVGLAICYDVRFPELFRTLTLQGAFLIAMPAAFNTTTGPAHWEVMIRSRAMENGIYVAASSPAPHSKVQYPSWGHSMIVDPFGKILAQAHRGESIIYAPIDLNYLKEVRSALPLLKARRPELYDLL